MCTEVFSLLVEWFIGYIQVWFANWFTIYVQCMLIYEKIQALQIFMRIPETTLMKAFTFIAAKD
jgi:hypothetical protein